MCTPEFFKGLNLKYFTATTIDELGNQVDAFRLELTPRVPILEIDVTDMFGSFRRYVEDDKGDLKPAYLGNKLKLRELEKICSRLNAKGTGTDDDTCAIRAAIAMVPDSPVFDCRTAKTSEGELVTKLSPVGGVVIRFPTPNSFYRVTETILLPRSKGVALVGSAVHGSTLRLQNATGELIPDVDSVFEMETDPVFGAVYQLTSRSVERLNLVNGGIALHPHLKRWQAIRDCVFISTPSWAIKSISDVNGNSDVVNLEIRRCVFLGCNGGVHAAGTEQLIGWSIDQCRFRGNTGVDVYIVQGEVHLVDCDFSGRRPDLLHLPYIQITKPAQATTITNCRIGSEAKPPRDLIVVGPLPGKLGPPFTDNDASSGHQDVLIEGCVFGGPNTPYNSESSVLRLRLAMTGLRLRSCTVWSFGKLLWEEAREGTVNVAANRWAQDASEDRPGIFTLANVAGQSLLAHLTILGTVGQVLTQGGRGFEVTGASLLRRLGRGAPEQRAGGNLLRDTEAEDLTKSPAWVGTINLSAQRVKDLSSPNGSTAWKLVRTSKQGFPARIAQKLDLTTAKGMFTGRPAVFSIWLRADAGETAIASLECVVNEVAPSQPSDAYFALAGSPIFRLSDQWRRYTLLIERLPLRASELDGDSLDGVLAGKLTPKAFDADRLLPRLRVNHGYWADQFGSTKESVIWAAQPQLELGDTPTPYVPGADNLSNSRPQRLEQSLMLGGNVVGYGTTPWTSQGPFFRGDLVLNTSPAIGGHRGWVWVPDIWPGWLSFGKIL